MSVEASSDFSAAAPRSSYGPLRQIDAGLLNVGDVDIGPAGGHVVVLLRGWPYEIRGYVDVCPGLAEAGYRVIVPFLRGFGTTRVPSDETFRNGEQVVLAVDVIALNRAGMIVNLEADRKPLPPNAELGWCYQYYFSTERGRLCYSENRREFNKLIWQIASPRWGFDDATCERTAASFANPDHIDIVIRWQLSLADGEPQHGDLEARQFGAAADGRAYAEKFSGAYSHRVLEGIGHNVPQEAPSAFTDAILKLGGGLP
jgi:pimeloyl-ACP methyl ester carboxylesterase